MTENKYCVVCEQKVTTELSVDKILGRNKAFEFKDGFRCEKCAKIKVDSMRSKRK